MIQITPHISVDESELEYSFVRASGPGGQNVNKVSSSVVLRFNIKHSSLPQEVKQRLIRLAGKRATEDGVFILKGQQFRTQERNRQAVLKRLIELIREASTAPKVRKATKPSRASQQARLNSKHRRKETKQLRRVANDMD
jgi:ribosome-associated protein